MVASGVLQVIIILPLFGAPPSAASFVSLGIMALLGAGSATGSLALARMAEDRELFEAGEDVAEVGLSPDEGQHLLGEGA